MKGSVEDLQVLTDLLLDLDDRAQPAVTAWFERNPRALALWIRAHNKETVDALIEARVVLPWIAGAAFGAGVTRVGLGHSERMAHVWPTTPNHFRATVYSNWHGPSWEESFGTLAEGMIEIDRDLERRGWIVLQPKHKEETKVDFVEDPG